MGLYFDDEELETYFRMRAIADNYLNERIRYKRVAEYVNSKKREQ